MAELLRCKELGALNGINHGFFTRKGGVSKDPLYASLNCGFGSGDKTGNVAKNRDRVTIALGVGPEQLITPYQTHSADVAIASNPWAHKDAPKADAIVTKTKKLAIAILTADCTPVLFADEKAGVIGAAHAGWRGAIGGILEATIDAMVAQGAKRGDIRAAIGPCLNQPNYEVGPEFIKEFNDKDPEYLEFFGQDEASQGTYFNLPGFVIHRIEGAGLKKISGSGVCTYENESKFFSYRRNTHQKLKDYGRQISAIVLT